jgi:hypothetical protein
VAGIGIRRGISSVTETAGMAKRLILRAPKALSQALTDALDGREPLFPQVDATSEAFFPALPGPAARVLRRGVPPLHGSAAGRRAAALRGGGGPHLPAVRRGRDPRRLPAGRHRPSAQASLGRAGRGAAGLFAGDLRPRPRGVSEPGLPSRCRRQRTDPRPDGVGRVGPGHVGAQGPTVLHRGLLRGAAHPGLLGTGPAQPPADPPQAPALAQAPPRRWRPRRLAGAGRHGRVGPRPAAALHPLAPRRDPL